MQKGYGEKAEDAATRDAGFQWMLGRFNIEQVKYAFRLYIERNADMPGPANIINLIEPPRQPLSGAVFFDIKKRWREGQYIMPDEKEYCRAYQEQELAKMRGGGEEYREIMKRLDAPKQKTYDIGYEGDGWEGEIE